MPFPIGGIHLAFSLTVLMTIKDISSELLAYLIRAPFCILFAFSSGRNNTILSSIVVRLHPFKIPTIIQNSSSRRHIQILKILNFTFNHFPSFLQVEMYILSVSLKLNVMFSQSISVIFFSPVPTYSITHQGKE